MFGADFLLLELPDIFLLKAGFAFDHPQWPEAAADLVRRVRGRDRRGTPPPTPTPPRKP